MDLCLITCNIRFDNPADGTNSWSHRRDLLTSTLLKHQPDIIATQEGRFDQLKEFEKLTGLTIIDHHRSWIRERMYPALFIKKNTFEVLGSGDAWLSLTPEIAGSLSFESTFPRLMTWTHLQLKNSDDSLFIVNTHLDHVKSETRLCQVNVLGQEVKRLWKMNCPLMILGDFNDAPESPVRKSLIAQFSLQDAWKKFNQKEETSHHAFKGEMQNGARIDWILIDEKTKIKDCSMDKTHDQGNFPTDHFPIICHITI